MERDGSHFILAGRHTEKDSSLALSFGATMTAVMDWKTQMKSGGATPKVAVSA